MSFPMLNRGGRDTERGRCLSYPSECIDHGADISHGDGMYDYRAGGQVAQFDLVTGAERAFFVQDRMDDRDQIINAFAASDMDRPALAGAMRISVPSLGRLLRKERRLTAIEREAAFDALGISDEWGRPFREVPVIGLIAAGSWAEAVQDPLGTTFTTKGGPNSSALRVEGDSMNLLAPSGASVVIDPDDRELREGRSYAVIRQSGEATFKRFRHDPARFEPVSTNPEHKAIEIGRDTFGVIGRAIEVTQDL